MSLIALGLLALGVTDLVRWSPERAARTRSAIGCVAAVTVVGCLAALAGWEAEWVAAYVGIAAVTCAGWVALDEPGLRDGDMYSLVYLAITVVGLIACSGLAKPVGAELAQWYANLGIPFADSASVDRFLLSLGCGVFLLATANRAVRQVLKLVGTPVIEEGEAALHGGRLLGPLERLFVAALMLGGELTGAAVVIAAKGLLRLPEIRSRRDRGSGAEDLVTEYFLIGTLTSWLIAAVMAGLVGVSG